MPVASRLERGQTRLLHLELPQVALCQAWMRLFVRPQEVRGPSFELSALTDTIPP